MPHYRLDALQAIPKEFIRHAQMCSPLTHNDDSTNHQRQHKHASRLYHHRHHHHGRHHHRRHAYRDFVIHEYDYVNSERTAAADIAGRRCCTKCHCQRHTRLLAGGRTNALPPPALSTDDEHQEDMLRKDRMQRHYRVQLDCGHAVCSPLPPPDYSIMEPFDEGPVDEHSPLETVFGPGAQLCGCGAHRAKRFLGAPVPCARELAHDLRMVRSKAAASVSTTPTTTIQQNAQLPRAWYLDVAPTEPAAENGEPRDYFCSWDIPKDIVSFEQQLSRASQLSGRVDRFRLRKALAYTSRTSSFMSRETQKNKLDLIFPLHLLKDKFVGTQCPTIGQQLSGAMVAEPFLSGARMLYPCLPVTNDLQQENFSAAKYRWMYEDHASESIYTLSAAEQKQRQNSRSELLVEAFNIGLVHLCPPDTCGQHMNMPLFGKAQHDDGSDAAWEETQPPLDELHYVWRNTNGQFLLCPRHVVETLLVEPVRQAVLSCKNRHYLSQSKERQLESAMQLRDLAGCGRMLVRQWNQYRVLVPLLPSWYSKNDAPLPDDATQANFKRTPTEPWGDTQNQFGTVGHIYTFESLEEVQQRVDEDNRKRVEQQFTSMFSAIITSGGAAPTTNQIKITDMLSVKRSATTAAPSDERDLLNSSCGSTQSSNGASESAKTTKEAPQDYENRLVDRLKRDHKQLNDIIEEELEDLGQRALFAEKHLQDAIQRGKLTKSLATEIEKTLSEVQAQMDMYNKTPVQFVVQLLRERMRDVGGTREAKKCEPYLGYQRFLNIVMDETRKSADRVDRKDSNRYMQKVKRLSTHGFAIFEGDGGGGIASDSDEEHEVNLAEDDGESEADFTDGDGSESDDSYHDSSDEEEEAEESGSGDSDDDDGDGTQDQEQEDEQESGDSDQSDDMQVARDSKDDLPYMEGSGYLPNKAGSGERKYAGGDAGVRSCKNSATVEVDDADIVPVLSTKQKPKSLVALRPNLDKHKTCVKEEEQEEQEQEEEQEEMSKFLDDDEDEVPMDVEPACDGNNGTSVASASLPLNEPKSATTACGKSKKAATTLTADSVGNGAAPSATAQQSKSKSKKTVSDAAEGEEASPKKPRQPVKEFQELTEEEIEKLSPEERTRYKSNLRARKRRQEQREKKLQEQQQQQQQEEDSGDAEPVAETESVGKKRKRSSDTGGTGASSSSSRKTIKSSNPLELNEPMLLAYRSFKGYEEGGASPSVMQQMREFWLAVGELTTATITARSSKDLQELNEDRAAYEKKWSTRHPMARLAENPEECERAMRNYQRVFNALSECIPGVGTRELSLGPLALDLNASPDSQTEVRDYVSLCYYYTLPAAGQLYRNTPNMPNPKHVAAKPKKVVEMLDI